MKRKYFILTLVTALFAGDCICFFDRETGKMGFLVLIFYGYFSLVGLNPFY